MNRSPIPRLCVLLLPLLMPVGGCATYYLGSTLRGYASIGVVPFLNQTGEPQLEFAATQETLAAFQRDGTLTVADAASADLVLEAVLVGATFEPLAYARNRSATAREFRYTITARMTVTDRKTGRKLYDGRLVRADYTFRSDGDTQQARLSAQSGVARDLAQRLVRLVVEYW